MIYWLPVILGFLIGLVTNAIAVMMMFRPIKRRPWLFFWPQGLVPREKKALAESVGRAVGQELLGPEQVTRMLSGAEGRERSRELVRRLISAAFDGLSGRRLAELLKVVSWKDWARALADFLDEQDRRKTLEDRIAAAIEANLSGLARRSLKETIGEQSLKLLEKRLAGRLRDTGVARKSEKFIEKSKYFFTPSAIAAWIIGDEDRTAVDKAADELAAYMTASVAGLPVGELLGIEDGETSLEDFSRNLARRAVSYLADGDNLEALVESVLRRLGPILEETPARFGEYLDPELTVEIRRGLEDAVHGLLCEHAATAVRALDVPGIVESRVNDYPTLELERLVLDISGRHLKWITLWGGILGALLGAVQLLIPH